MKRTMAGIVAMSFALVAHAANPPKRDFGPDTTSTFVNTGSAVTPGLVCNSTVTPVTCSGYLASDVDGTRLDVTVWLPGTTTAHPLLAGIHGWGGSKNSMRSYAQRMTDAGFALLSYSARGFGNSYGQTNLADVNVEGADLRSMIGQAADDPQLNIDASAVGVFGASYGGAHSFLAALRPNFTSPAGKSVTIKAIAPIVPWSELTSALRPNGAKDPISPAGGLKFSYVQALYIGGCDDEPVCSNYPDYLKLWNAWMLATEPNNVTAIDKQIVDGFSGYRSIYWQQDFWAQRIPIFLVQGWTDDLFPVPEALRMYDELKKLDATYPVALYFGDIGHPRARNKPDEVDYVIDQVEAWFRWYLKGEGTQPAFDVQAAITRPKDVPFVPADVIRVATVDDLAPSKLNIAFTSLPQLLTFNPANVSGVMWDPAIITGSEELPYWPGEVAPDFVPGDVASYEAVLTQDRLIAGRPEVTMTITTAAFREQLDVRLFDIKPDGAKYLVTRGTMTLDTGNLLIPIGTRSVKITTYGDLWQANAGDRLRLEITNVDSPYIEPSKVPSVTVVTGVTLKLPIRP